MKSIAEFPNFYSQEECAKILRLLFDRREFWERRSERTLEYRNGEWFTLGSALYLDLKTKEDWKAYKDKVAYFNGILYNLFEIPSDIYFKLRERLAEFCFNDIHQPEVKFLSKEYEHAGLPGFHIFGPCESLSQFFGRTHQDLQWQVFKELPGFPFALEDMSPHFSITLPLALPYQGGGLLMGEKLERNFRYNTGSLYLHSGQFEHAIAPYKYPVLPFDWRITLQAHGFVVNNTIYLYW